MRSCLFLVLLTLIKFTAPAAAELRFVEVGVIEFEFDRVGLLVPSPATLNAVARYVHQHPTIERLLIYGHADQIGSRRYNDRLSDQRTLAAYDYLNSLGVPVGLIKQFGYGEDRPIDEHWQRLGRARNRHVEVYAVERFEPMPMAEPLPLSTQEKAP